MANIEDQIQRQARAISSMQSIDAIMPVEEGTDISGIEAGLNAVIAALEEIRNSPGANIPKGEKVEPIVPVPNLVEGDGIHLDNNGEEIVISVASVVEDEEPGGDEGRDDWENPVENPLVLYSTFEGSEDAQTDSWDADSPGPYDGVKVYKTMRVVYKHDDGGDEKLYGFYREFIYDVQGNLKNISAETIYEIDEPEAC